MEICSGDRNNSHDEIVFDSRSCPLCQTISDLKDAEKEIDRLENLE